ncbi:hypothetical protein EVAR_87013_1 [Eumeta japonica]|uniref:Uncharacterized protein n=1 Tax=Eumeta variegata TaxID=151549 RepID=A0A4C1W8C5_EUMVA|nr:hypothetical protein EVAR_87013_1 [Eumeta japonica]
MKPGSEPWAHTRTCTRSRVQRTRNGRGPRARRQRARRGQAVRRGTRHEFRARWRRASCGVNVDSRRDQAAHRRASASYGTTAANNQHLARPNFSLLGSIKEVVGGRGEAERFLSDVAAAGGAPAAEMRARRSLVGAPITPAEIDAASLALTSAPPPPPAECIFTALSPPAE